MIFSVPQPIYITGHYNSTVRIIDLVSHTTYVVCVNIIQMWRDLQFKVDYERQIFLETFHGNFIYSQRFCQKSVERKSSKKYFSYFVLMSDLGLELYLLDHGDFMVFLLDRLFHLLACLHGKHKQKHSILDVFPI